MGKINILSLVIATVIPTIMGMIYYSKFLFQKPWMEAIGMTEEKMKSANMGVISAITLVTSFLIAFFMLNYNNGIGQEGEFDTFKHGAFHGILISVFVVVPVLISKGLYEQATWKGMLIGALYWIITLALMGGVMDAMNHWPNVAS